MEINSDVFQARNFYSDDGDINLDKINSMPIVTIDSLIPADDGKVVIFKGVVKNKSMKNTGIITEWTCPLCGKEYYVTPPQISYRERYVDEDGETCYRTKSIYVCEHCSDKPVLDNNGFYCKNWEELQPINPNEDTASIPPLVVETGIIENNGKRVELIHVNGIPYLNGKESDTVCAIGRLNMCNSGWWRMTTDFVKEPTEIILQELTSDVPDESVPTDTSRSDPEYRKWRKRVCQRDKKCLACGGDKHLEVHHMYGYKDYPELRVDPDNGVTLCTFCHQKYHSYYGKKDITPIRFVKFLRRFMVR